MALQMPIQMPVSKVDVPSNTSSQVPQGIAEMLSQINNAPPIKVRIQRNDKVMEHIAMALKVHFADFGGTALTRNHRSRGRALMKLTDVLNKSSALADCRRGVEFKTDSLKTWLEDGIKIGEQARAIEQSRCSKDGSIGIYHPPLDKVQELWMEIYKMFSELRQDSGAPDRSESHEPESPLHPTGNLVSSTQKHNESTQMNDTHKRKAVETPPDTAQAAEIAKPPEKKQPDAITLKAQALQIQADALMKQAEASFVQAEAAKLAAEAANRESRANARASRLNELSQLSGFMEKHPEFKAALSLRFAAVLASMDQD